MKVSDYIPNLYNKNLEMHNIIYSEEEELENGLKLSIENSFKDNFAIVATEKGIEKFEEMFKIEVDPEEETLEFRRERVINRLISQIPFTEKYLINRLNRMLGEGNWTYTINYNAYTLTVTTLIPGRIWYRELVNLMDELIPCNIDYTIEIFSATWGKVRDTYTDWQAIKNTDMTWQQLMDAEWST